MQEIQKLGQIIFSKVRAELKVPELVKSINPEVRNSRLYGLVDKGGNVIKN